MIPDEARSWSRERVQQEIRNKEAQIRELQEAIDYHTEMADRLPDQGYQGGGLDSEQNELRREIRQLTELL